MISGVLRKCSNTILDMIMNSTPEEQGSIGAIAQAAYFKLNYGGKKRFQETNNLRANNERQWLETEYVRNDITVQPVLVNGELWYTVIDDHGYNFLFDTLLGLYEYLKDGKYEEGNCFETEAEMIKYLEKV